MLLSSLQKDVAVMDLNADKFDAFVNFVAECGAHAATMAACAAAVLDDDAPLPDGLTDELVLADYWFNVGRRTAAVTDLCRLLDCDFAEAMGVVAALVPFETDPAEQYVPVDGVATLPDELAGGAT